MSKPRMKVTNIEGVELQEESELNGVQPKTFQPFDLSSIMEGANEISIIGLVGDTTVMMLSSSSSKDEEVAIVVVSVSIC